MKRFWTKAEAVRTGENWGVELDGRPLKTPARVVLELPNQAVAEAIAKEWQGAGEAVDPRAMPLTGLANAAIDRIGGNLPNFVSSLAEYGETDLLYYRSEGPFELLERQETAWDPLLEWARARFDVTFRVTTGIQHVAQIETALARLGHALDGLGPFRLAAMSQLITIGGSLIVALAIHEGELATEQAWLALTIDDRWNFEKWGADQDAVAALAAREREFLSAAEFLRLLA